MMAAGHTGAGVNYWVTEWGDQWLGNQETAIFVLLFLHLWVQILLVLLTVGLF